MNFALNPFDRGKKPEIVEDIVQEDKELDELYEMLRSDLKGEIRKAYSVFAFMPVLEPARIDLLIQKCLGVDNANDKSSRIGRYANFLIQKSFDAGYNGFSLTLNDNKLDLLGSRLLGHKERKLNLCVYGNSGENFGDEAYACDFNLDGVSQGSVGVKAKYCSFNLRKIVSYSAPFNTTIPNKIGLFARYCTFVIDEIVGDQSIGYDAEDCKFCSSNPETLHKLRECSNKFGPRCEVILL